MTSPLETTPTAASAPGFTLPAGVPPTRIGDLMQILAEHGCTATTVVDGQVWCTTCDLVIGVDDETHDEVSAEHRHVAEMIVAHDVATTATVWGVREPWGVVYPGPANSEAAARAEVARRIDQPTLVCRLQPDWQPVA